MFDKYKNIIITIGIVLAVLAFLLWYFYKQGKKTVTLQYLPNQLPGSKDAQVDPSGASNSEIKNLVTDLYNDMNGFNWMGHNYQPYLKALLFSDSDLIKLYNAFNTLYQKEAEQTLTQWIESERYTQPNNPGLLVARLKKLNCL